MKRVIRFSRIRFFMFALSVLLIAGGMAGLYLRGGFNLGIDFTGGVNKQVQIAPPALALTYQGAGLAEVNVAGGRVQIEFSGAAEQENVSMALGDYATVGDVASALGGVPGVDAEVLGSPGAPATAIISLNFPVNIAGSPLVVNRRLAPDEEIYAPIDSVRDALSELGTFTIQAAGDPRNQEFILKVPTPGEDDRDFLERIDTRPKRSIYFF